MKPLQGMRILVTRASAQASIVAAKIKRLGGEPILLPTLDALPLDDTFHFDRMLRELNRFDWVIFTSIYAVKFTLERLDALNVGAEALRHIKVAAIGPETSKVLQVVGVTIHHMPEEYLSLRIPEGLGDLEGKRILLVRATVASKILPDLLRRRGATVAEAAAYRTTIPSDLTPERVEATFRDGVDVAMFTSGSTARNLASTIGSVKLGEYLRKTKVACIGPATANTVKELGVNVDVVADVHTVDGLLEAIVNELGSIRVSG